MSDKIFVDTNILVYAYDLDAGDKRVKALAVVDRLWDEGNSAPSPHDWLTRCCLS